VSSCFTYRSNKTFLFTPLSLINRVKAAISSSIYRKSLRLASSEQQKTTLGEIVNLMQVDAAKIEAFMIQIHVLWDGLFQIAGYMIILGTLLGWTCIIGMLLIMASIPMMGKITGKMFGLNRSMVKYSDQRVKAVNEALQGILCVKMYTWESSLAKEIDGFRLEELRSLRRIAYLRAFFRSVMSALPVIAAAATFLVYVYGSNGSISASTLFASIVAFDMLRMPLMFYPMSLAQYAQAKVSLKRVGLFLGCDEVNKVGYTRKPNENGEITIENASLYWSDPAKPLPRSVLDETSRNSSMNDSQHSSSSNQQLSKQSSRRISRRVSSSRNSAERDAPDPVTVEAETELIYPKPILKDVNIHVSTGTLCAIVGPVGSGKSTLCSAILNEAVLGEGSRVALHGSVAYVAQTAWILNKTVRDNILFGLPYDKERYEQVIDACSLRHDIGILEDGDQTEIGERGINLSGGQKQRISLARAAYSGADVFIFDDPLSALDPEVAQKVFEECIHGLLAGKTRLLVTNNLQFLSECDFIVAFSKHGKIVEQGTYADLMSDKRGEVTRLLRGITPSRRSLVKEDKVDEVKKKDDTKSNAIDAKNLITKEERQTGSVKLNVYLKYIQAGGGYLFFSCIFLTYMLSTGTNVMTSVWVAMWTADATSGYSNGKSETFFIVGYALLSIFLGFMTFFRSYSLASFGVRSSFNLHGNVLRSVLKAPMSFFDTTPTGRILSRFSKDMFTVDNEIADFVDMFVFIVLQLIVVMISIVVITPYFAVALPFLGYLYIRAMNYFRQVSRETKRLESVARSPVYSQFSETLGGLSTIRAYGKSSKFIHSFGGLLDLNSRTIYCNKASDRWLATRLEGIASCVVGLSAFFATSVVVSNGASVGDPSNFASFAGISLSYAVTATGMMQFVVRAFAQVEAAMNSVERITYYTEEIPHEAALTSKELESEKPSALMNTAQKVVAATGSVVYPSKEWPASGSITLTGLKMKYRPETPLVLKGLDVKINAGERVGIVGRTGSGKSSMLLILMRLVEPFFTDDELKTETYKAPLIIDGVDVMRIGLFDLRSRVGIIPQSPVLFSGTIRSNLDPFGDFSDQAIWDALEKCRMKEAVAVMTDGLLSRVAEYGENLSQGQRQLLCLGRAVLKKANILLLDEATSSVDFETDRMIQLTIREAFKGCTVLTIAHRVNTIMDSDKILVMNDGVVAEFDSPEVLLQNKESIFSDIVSHANGDEEED
jgi:ATP-binding cassette subfamily C (CFTR/MRP) protein 1